MTKPVIIAVGLLACVFIAMLWFRGPRQESGSHEEFPLIYNVANFMNAAELKEVEKTIRDRGEQYVISIAVVSSNNAQVHVGDGAFLRPRSGRVYKVARIEGAWQIENVESWKH